MTIIIGTILDNTYIDIPSNANTRLQLSQGIVHEAYILYLYELFKVY